jgi:peptide/nickel transport system permease protein
MINFKEKINSSHWFNRILSMFLNDKLAFVSIIFLIFIVFLSILGPSFINDSFIKMNLRLRNLEPFSFEHHFMYFFGADALGRSMIARLIVATQNTIFIAGSAVFLSMTIGGVLGLISGYFGGKCGNLIMRIADIIMSFPSLLLAVIVLYMFDPGLINLIIVLAFTRMPIYMRTARAEVLEIRERLFVSAAISMGASDSRIIFKHIAPLTIPTLITIATLDFAFVMLGESALSFLGVGIQPPEVTWGLMVAQGRNYLQIAWWLAFFPGLMIMLVALSLNLLSSWLRIVLDPTQRWRLENIGDKND